MVAFRFGRFELDLRARELLKDGVRLRLQDQPFEVLAMLLERPGEVLTRDELRIRLWPDGTFVDFEHGLNAAVKRLRAALGDNADRPRFVETLHRRGYRFIARVEPVNKTAPDRMTPGADGVDGSSSRLRLAVLPFTNLAEPSNDYFSDGLTEELITQLGRLCANRIGVVARGSCMLVDRRGRRVREIGQALRADYLVEGTVRRESDRVRVTVQLIGAHDETQLWAESYDRHLSDCLLVQSDVAKQIVHSLAMELLPDGRGTRAAATRDAAAYQAYLKGRYHWNQSGGEGLTPAIGFFQQAIALDPRFGAAYAGAGRSYVALAEYYLQQPRTALEAARSAALRALDLDAADSEAYLTLAEVKRALDHDWHGAEEEYRRALGFNPSNEGAHRLYGLFLAAQGRAPEAVSAADRARDLDPLCLVANTSAAWVRFICRQYGAAIELCRHTIDMNERFVPARRLLAATLLQQGAVDQSIDELEGILSIRDDATTLACLAHACASGGHHDRAASVARRLEALSHTGYVSPYHRALAHAAVGDADRTFALLGEARNDCDPFLMHVGVDPRFDSVRSDRRYRQLMNDLSLDIAAAVHV